MQKHKLVNYWKRWSRPERCGKKIHNKKKKKQTGNNYQDCSTLEKIIKTSHVPSIQTFFQ